LGVWVLGPNPKSPIPNPQSPKLLNLISYYSQFNKYIN
jgi:hypothetical protein